MSKTKKINYNKSIYCVLPILNLKREQLLYDNGLLNCYLKCKFLDGYKNHFFLSYSKKNIDTDTIKLLSNHELFEDLIDNFRDIIIFVFHISETYKSDIDYYKIGKYSLFSKELKKQILYCHSLTPKKRLYQILYRSKSLKLKLEQEIDEQIPDNAELWDIPYSKDLCFENLNHD